MIDGGCYEGLNGRMMHGSGREIATPLEKRKRPTRKDMHAEGIKFLQAAMEAVDQADSCFRDAKTRDGDLSYRKDAYKLLERALQYNMQQTCYDCDKPIADCACAWANEEVK